MFIECRQKSFQHVLDTQSGGSSSLHRMRKNSTRDTVLKGHGFIRAASTPKSASALAAEGSFITPDICNRVFPQPLQAAECGAEPRSGFSHGSFAIDPY